MTGCRTARRIAFTVPTDFLLADQRLNSLASRVEYWRPGAYAGGLYAAFADAQDALSGLEPSQAAYARERLERLATRVGVLMPRSEDVAGTSIWHCAGVVKSQADPWHVAEVVNALFPQPSVQARVTLPAARTVELWFAMPHPAGYRTLRRIEAVLTRDSVRQQIGNCLVLPTR